MKNITVAKIRQALADNPDREDWLQVSRMSDDEIKRSIDAGFSWPRRMFDPYDPEKPLDLSDLDDDDDAAALLRSQPS